MTQQQTKTALITGATGGIGYEFCKHFARDQTNLVMIARNQPELKRISEQLQAEFGIETLIIALDLTVPDAPQKIYQMMRDQGVQINYLINNAGVGFHGAFSDSNPNDINLMINLNITALVQLTRLFLPDMLQQGKGHILNVASLAAFQPGGPNAAVYYASKNFVLAFNRALVAELKGTPVYSTAFCPGPLKTGFSERGGFSATRLYRYFSTDTRKQVAKAYRKAMKGKSTVVPGLVNKILAFSGEFPPRSIALSVNKFLLK